MFKSALIAAVPFFFMYGLCLAQPVNATYSTAGNYIYTIPTGYSAKIKVEVWGAGGGGGGSSYITSGGGGGGGGYASRTYDNLPAGDYDITVGAGGTGAFQGIEGGFSYASYGEPSLFSRGNQILSTVAQGGEAGNSLILTTPPVAGTGGIGGTNNWGTITHNGGNGGQAPEVNTNDGPGGGGGGSATAIADGKHGGNGNISTGMGGSGGVGEGNGGSGGRASAPETYGVPGAAPGGGGGGKARYAHLSGDGADGQVKITVESVLPVHFGSFSAVLYNNQLAVNFSTLSETNNDHFNLQASENGADFKTIATIRSKNINGNANGPTEYYLTLDIAGKISFALAALALLALGTLGFTRKTRIILCAAFILGAASMLIKSCQKKEDAVSAAGRLKTYLRIQQVDKNGHSEYSKVITITKS